MDDESLGHEESLSAARAGPGTRTIKDAVDKGLRRVTFGRRSRTSAALDVLAGAPPDDRANAWR
jgi:hypothetical protein